MRRFETENPARPALGLPPRPGRAFIANLTAGAGRRAGKRRDGGGMIVRLDLHQDVDGFVAGFVAMRVHVGEPALAGRPFDHGGVIAIRRQHAVRIAFVRVADHREQRLALRARRR